MKEGRDSLSVGAHAVFVLVAGLLVVGFAWTLLPAARAHRDADCRPLHPMVRSGAAPDLELLDLEGQPVSLADFRGRTLVLNFWGTYCEPCTAEWGDLDRLAQRFADREDVVVAAVALDPEQELIAPYLTRMALTDTNVKVWWDPTGLQHGEFALACTEDSECGGETCDVEKGRCSVQIPDTYVIDSEGDLRVAFINSRAWGRSEAYRCIDSFSE